MSEIVNWGDLQKNNEQKPEKEPLPGNLKTPILDKCQDDLQELKEYIPWVQPENAEAKGDIWEQLGEWFDWLVNGETKYDPQLREWENNCER